jgi:hypothetical protein
MSHEMLEADKMAESHVGHILYKDDKCVVRGAWRTNGSGQQEFRVMIHQVINGVEYSPKGYWLGSNMAIWEKRNG